MEIEKKKTRQRLQNNKDKENLTSRVVAGDLSTIVVKATDSARTCMLTALVWVAIFFAESRAFFPALRTAFGCYEAGPAITFNLRFLK